MTALDEKALELAVEAYDDCADSVDDYGLKYCNEVPLRRAIEAYLEAAKPSEQVVDCSAEYSRGYDVGYLQATQEMLAKHPSPDLSEVRDALRIAKRDINDWVSSKVVLAVTVASINKALAKLDELMKGMG